MTPFLAEIVGTLLLILRGDGVVANVLFSRLRHNAGWTHVSRGMA